MRAAIPLTLLLLFILPAALALSVTPGGFVLPENTTRATLTLTVTSETSVTITPEGSLAPYTIIQPSRLGPGTHRVNITIHAPKGVERSLRLLITPLPTREGFITAQAGIIIPISTPKITIRLHQPGPGGVPSLIITTPQPLRVKLTITNTTSTVWQEERFEQPREGRIIIPLNLTIPYAAYTLHVTAGQAQARFPVILGTPTVTPRITWQQDCLALISLTNPTRLPVSVKILTPIREDLGLLPPGEEKRVSIYTCTPTTLTLWLNGMSTSIQLAPPVRKAPSPIHTSILITLTVLLITLTILILAKA